MRNRYTQRPELWDYTGNQLARINEKLFCSFCPPHNNENSRGSHSNWGRKVAAKTFYATGKGRKEQKDFCRRGRHLWFCDKHYESEPEPKRRKQKVELDRKNARLMLDEYIRWLKANRNVIADTASGRLNKCSWSGAEVSIAEMPFGNNLDRNDFSFYITLKRRKPYFQYLPPES